MFPSSCQFNSDCGFAARRLEPLRQWLPCLRPYEAADLHRGLPYRLLNSGITVILTTALPLRFITMTLASARTTVNIFGHAITTYSSKSQSSIVQ